MSATKKVTVRQVHISKGYGDDDVYSCSVTLQSPTGEINLKLKEDRVNQIVELVAGLVVEATTEAMKSMTSAAMAHKAIEHKPDEDAKTDPEETA